MVNRCYSAAGSTFCLDVDQEESLMGSEPSIADMIRDAANEVLHSRVPEGFQWVGAYGQYYSPSCGFFYDPNTSLFYHSESETFYIFNDDNQQYEVYKCMRKVRWKSRANKKKASQLFPGALDRFDQDAVDVCEIVFDITSKLCLHTDGIEDDDGKDVTHFLTNSSTRKEIDEYNGRGSPLEYFDDKTGEITYISKNAMRFKCTSDSEKSKELWDVRQQYPHEVLNNGAYDSTIHGEVCSDESSEEEDERIQMREDEGFLQPPLLRIIDSKNNLHIITMSGGSVGRQTDSDIVIEDPSVSRKLLGFAFVPESNSFVVIKLTDKGHVTLNDYELTANDSREIAHGDFLRLGSECLQIHIHFGNNTCTGCEPGLLIAGRGAASQPPSIPCGETARRRNLKAIKAMYGINEYVENSRTLFYGDDRAAKRRRLIGSEINIRDKEFVDPNDIHAGCLAKPLPGAVLVSNVDTEQPLNEANKGFRLLKSMGWNEGKGLGKGEQGRHEPVKSAVCNQRLGLGAAEPKPTIKSRKDAILEKTRERYIKLDNETK